MDVYLLDLWGFVLEGRERSEENKPSSLFVDKRSSLAEIKPLSARAFSSLTQMGLGNGSQWGEVPSICFTSSNRMGNFSHQPLKLSTC